MAALGLLVISANAVAGKGEAVADSGIIEQRAALTKIQLAKASGLKHLEILVH